MGEGICKGEGKTIVVRGSLDSQIDVWQKGRSYRSGIDEWVKGDRYNIGEVG